MALVELHQVSKHFGAGATRVHALHQVNLHIGAGEMVAIMGASGSGKSTLLHLIGGLDTPSSGEVKMEGQTLSTMNDKALSILRRRRIGFIFQSYNLIPALTARENVAMPLILDGLKRPEAFARADAALDTVGLSNHATQRPAELSGGQQQRVSIARALAIRPPLILADEPTGALDSETGQEIVRVLRGLVARFGHSVVMVTHDPKVAAHAHRIVTIRDGTIIDDNTLTQQVQRRAPALMEAGA